LSAPGLAAGTIQANTGILTISANTTVNSGTLSASTSSDTLILSGATIQNNGGKIAAGSGTVILDGCTVAGGTLASGYGVIRPFPTAQPPTLNGVTIVGQFQATLQHQSRRNHYQ
jgi:hypothetical protein